MKSKAMCGYVVDVEKKKKTISDGLKISWIVEYLKNEFILLLFVNTYS